MAKVSSKNALVMLDDANGVARNISAACRSYEIQYQRNTLPVTAFGDAHEVMALGRGAYAIGLDVLYDNTATTGTYDVINGAVSDGVARTLSVYPQGLGGPVYSGEFVCQGPSYNGASSGMPVSLGSLKFFPASSTAPGFNWKYRAAVGYWPLAIDALDYSGNARNLTPTAMTYTGTGINDGLTASVFDGSSSQGQATASWFSGTAGTFAIWAKVSALGDWTDGNYHYVYNIYADTNNRILLRKNSGSNYLEFFNYFGTVAHNTSILRTYTTWFHMAVTWATSGNVVVYENGTSILSTALAGTWAGTPTFYLGAGPTFNWKGNLAHAALWNTALSASDILTLATV